MHAHGIFERLHLQPGHILLFFLSLPGWTQIQIYILAAFQQQQHRRPAHNSTFSFSTRPSPAEPAAIERWQQAASAEKKKSLSGRARWMESEPGFRRCELAEPAKCKSRSSAFPEALTASRARDPIQHLSGRSVGDQGSSEPCQPSQLRLEMGVFVFQGRGGLCWMLSAGIAADCHGISAWGRLRAAPPALPKFLPLSAGS